MWSKLKYWEKVAIIANVLFIAAIMIWVHDHSSQINNIILLLTGDVVAYYTYETYLLRKAAQEERSDSIKPVVLFDKEPAHLYGWTVRNVGKGPALNVKFRISRFNNDTSYGDLRDLIDGQHNYKALGNSEEDHLSPSHDTIDMYMANKQGYVEDRIALLITYTDIGSKDYGTIIKCNVLRAANGSATGFSLKDTQVFLNNSARLPQFKKHIIETESS